MIQASALLYIRFGEIPEDGVSGVHRGDAILRKEAGLSVYRAVKEGICYYPIMPEHPNENTVATYFDLLLHSDKRVFLVTGDEMPIEGADREPLLTNVTVLKDITCQYRSEKNDGNDGMLEVVCTETTESSHV